MIKSYLPNKSGNPMKNNHDGCKALAMYICINVYNAGKDLLRAFCKFFNLNNCNSYKCNHKFAFTLFCSFVETKHKNKKRKIFLLLASNASCSASEE